MLTDSLIQITVNSAPSQLSPSQLVPESILLQSKRNSDAYPKH